MPDAVLEVLARAIVEPLQAGMAEAAEAVTASTAEMNAAFAGAAAVASEAQAGEAAAVKEATASMMEDLGALKAQVVTTGEAFLSAGSLIGGFGALFAVPIIGEYFNKLKDTELELGHMSAAAQMSIKDLTEWHEVLKLGGLSVEAFDKLLPRLQAHMVMARDGSKQQKEAFDQLRISTDSWAAKLPGTNDVLMEMAQRLHEDAAAARDGKVPAEDVAAVYFLLGRAAGPFVSFLEQGSDALKKQKDAFSELGEQAEKSHQAAVDFQEAETKLGAQIDTLALPALRELSSLLMRVEADTKHLGQGFLDSIPIIAVTEIAWDKLNKKIHDTLSGGKLPDVLKPPKPPDFALDKTPKAPEEDSKERMKDDEAQIRSAETMGRARLAARRAEIEGEIELDEISKVEGLARLKELANQEYEIEQSTIARIRGLKVSDPTEERDRQRTLNAQQEALYARHVEEIARLDTQMSVARRAMAAEDARVEEERGREAERAAIKRGEAEIRAAAEARKAAERDDEEDLRHRLEMDRLWLEGRQTNLKKDYDNGKYNSKQLLAEEKNALDQKLALDRKAIEATLAMIDALGDPTMSAKAAKKLHAELETLELQHKNAIAKIDEKAAADQKKIWDKTFTQFSKEFDGQVKQILAGQETIGQGFAKIWSDMVNQALAAMEKILVQWVEQHVLMMTISAAQKKSEILGTAYEAAAHAYSATSDIPIVGPILAPAAAAAAFAATAAFGGSVPSAQGGMVVPAETRETLAILHSSEMVLPAATARGLNTLISGGPGGGGGPSPAPTINISMGTINAIDAKGVDAVLRSRMGTIAKIVRQALRDNAL